MKRRRPNPAIWREPDYEVRPDTDSPGFVAVAWDVLALVICGVLIFWLWRALA